MKIKVLILSLLFFNTANAFWGPTSPERVVEKCYNEIVSRSFQATIKRAKFDQAGDLIVNSHFYAVTGIGVFKEFEVEIGESKYVGNEVKKGKEVREEVFNSFDKYDISSMSSIKRASLAKCITSQLIEYDFKNTYQGIWRTFSSRKGGCMDYSRVFNSIAASDPFSLTVDKARGYFVSDNTRVEHSFNVIELNGAIYYLEPQSKSPIFIRLPDQGEGNLFRDQISQESARILTLESSLLGY